MQALRKRLDNKGFTLVELIVVLVILAILATLMIPTMSGYIDRARKEKVSAEARMVVMAVQTEVSAAYGSGNAAAALDTSGGDIYWRPENDDGHIREILKLAELPEDDSVRFQATVQSNCEIQTVTYWNGTYKCTYYGSTYSDETLAGTYQIVEEALPTEVNQVVITAP